MLVNMGLNYQSLPDRDGQGVPKKKKKKKKAQHEADICLSPDMGHSMEGP